MTFHVEALLKYKDNLFNFVLATQTDNIRALKRHEPTTTVLINFLLTTQLVSLVVYYVIFNIKKSHPLKVIPSLLLPRLHRKLGFDA